MFTIESRDTDAILISFFDIDGLRNLYRVNKFYFLLIRPKLIGFITFYAKVKKIKSPYWLSHETIFYKAIVDNNIQICIYLQKKHKYYVSEITQSIQLACELGRLDICKWLYNVCKADIFTNDQYCLRLACENGHLEVAQSPFGPLVRRCKQVCICE